MCSQLGCNAGSYLRDGDQRGLRQSYPSEDRLVYLGTSTSLAASSVGFMTGARAFFPPRIDCAKAASSPANQCAMVTTERLSNSTYVAKVWRLNGYTSGASFTTKTVVATLAFSQANPPTGSPDIALNVDGTMAFVAFATSANDARAFLTRIDMASGATLATINLGYGVAHPPRVTFHSDSGAAVVVAERVNPVGNDGYGTTTFAVTRISPSNAAATSALFTSANIGPASEYDVDCERDTSATDSCVVVAQIAETSAALELPWSRKFTLTGGVVQADANWAVGSYRVNAVLGVAALAGKNGAPRRLIVSAGRGVYSGTDGTNTRLIERSGFDLNAGPVGDATAVSDVGVTCAAASHRGIAIPSAATNGGYSISFCQSCGSGRLVSVHLGPGVTGDNFCH